MFKFLLLALFIVVGGIGNYAATKKMPSLKQHQYWIKFFVYILWVTGVITCTLHWAWFYTGMAIAVCFIGLIEILRFNKLASIKDYAIVLVYSTIASGFVLFCFWAQSTLSEMLIVTFILVCICDGFSQITGQLFGKIKVLKRISPTKTLEGFLGGISIMFFSAWFIMHDPMNIQIQNNWATIAIVVAIGAPIGDVLSSSLKRYFNIKDFGSYFPGQGGVLDRYDSHIFTGALFYILHLLKNYYA